jgi:hypothetical protein
MHPLHVSEFQKDRQEELVGAADAWRLAHPCGRHTLRYRTGARLMNLSRRLMGNNPEDV